MKYILFLGRGRYQEVESLALLGQSFSEVLGLGLKLQILGGGETFLSRVADTLTYLSGDQKKKKKTKIDKAKKKSDS